jgi:hypothetical protein
MSKNDKGEASAHAVIVSNLLSRDKLDPFTKVVTFEAGPNRGQQGRVRGIETLAHAMGLESHTGLSGGQAKIAAANIPRFAEIFEFSTDSACMDALNKHDAPGFRKAFDDLRKQSKHNDKAGDLTIDPSKVRLRLLAGNDTAPVVASLGSMVVYSSIQEFDAGTDALLSATLSCRPATLESMRVALRYCKLRFERTSEENWSPHKPRGESSYVVKNGDRHDVKVWRGDIGKRQVIEIAATGTGAIGWVELPPDLWTVLHTQPDDTFKVEMIICIRDCVIATDESPASLYRTAGDVIGDTALQKIEKRFKERIEFETDEPWVVQHLITFKLVQVLPSEMND